MNENDIHQPHDAITKIVLRDEERMSDFLSTLLPDYLPEHIFNDLILEQAQREDTSHINPEYEKYFSDLLFSVPRRSGGRMRLYFLIEHKSYYDRLVPFQILKNMTAILEEQTKEFQPIIAILFYHGGTKWDIPLSFQTALGYSETTRSEYGCFMPEFKFLAIRVKEDKLVLKIQPIRIKSFLGVLLIADAEEQDVVFMDFLRISLPLINSKEGLLYFDILLGYAKHVYTGDIEKLSEKVGKEMGTQMEQLVMTGGKDFFRELQITAFMEGEAKGEARGMKERTEDIALNLIQAGVSAELIQEATGLSRKRLSKLGMPQK